MEVVVKGQVLMKARPYSVVSIPTSQSRGPRSNSRPEEWLSRLRFRGFPHVLQANSMTISQIRPLPLPSTSFSIQYLLITRHWTVCATDSDIYIYFFYCSLFLAPTGAWGIYESSHFTSVS
jgi:hypothetical protein